ncbi:MAG: NYN domain-containing protein [Candidatus Magasanikbacteria bacterium]|nr:NYN domain-containing protein [Candidatus Magasanikbacteria bacterium]
MDKTKRTAILIDGSNFYFKMKSLGIKNLLKYDYRGLCEYLAGGRQIITVGYYIGVVRAAFDDVKGQRLRLAQIDLFNQLRDHKITVHKGYLMKNDGVYHEKGVDVKIATDLLVGAYENLFDDAIVISSDTDLIPAFSKVKKLGKGIEYIGFGHQPTLALQKFATISRLLVLDELQKFCK